MIAECYRVAELYKKDVVILVHQHDGFSMLVFEEKNVAFLENALQQSFSRKAQEFGAVGVLKFETNG